jgi:hypothetical protein
MGAGLPEGRGRFRLDLHRASRRRGPGARGRSAPHGRALPGLSRGSGWVLLDTATPAAPSRVQSPLTQGAAVAALPEQFIARLGVAATALAPSPSRHEVGRGDWSRVVTLLIKWRSVARLRCRGTPRVHFVSVTGASETSARASVPVRRGRETTAGASAPAGRGRETTAGASAPAGRGRETTAGASAPVGRGRETTAGASAPVGRGRETTARAGAPATRRGVAMGVHFVSITRAGGTSSRALGTICGTTGTMTGVGASITRASGTARGPVGAITRPGVAICRGVGSLRGAAGTARRAVGALARAGGTICRAAGALWRDCRAARRADRRRAPRRAARTV